MRRVAVCLVLALFVCSVQAADFVQIKSCDFDQLTDMMDLVYYYPSFQGSGLLDNDAALGAKSLRLTTGNTFQNKDGDIGVLNECVVDFYLSVGTDDNSAGNIDYNRLDFMNSNGDVFAGIGFKPDGTGTGTFGLQMFSGVSGYFTPLASGLPINSWEHLRIEIKLTNTAVAKPTGTLTVSRELAGSWQIVAQSNFGSFSDFTGQTKGVMRCKFFANDITWKIDEVKIGLFTDNVSVINANMSFSSSFLDNFEGTLDAYWGSTGTYAVLTADQAVSPTHSVVINDNGSNDWMAKPITSTSETWIDLQFMVKSGSGNTGPYNGIDFKGVSSDTSYKVPLGIHYQIEGSGYGLYLLDGSSGYYHQLVTNLPLNTWAHLKIGVRMLSANNGLLWVYSKNGSTWQTIVAARYWIAFQSLDTGIDVIQFTAHGNSIAIDDLNVGNPLYCGMSGTQYLAGDMNRDCYINMADFAAIAQIWLECTDPANVICN